jgi:hypothetical protein
MRKRTELVIITTKEVITQGLYHCNNDCPNMYNERALIPATRLFDKPKYGDWVTTCSAFGGLLAWDNKYKGNGYRRHPECIKKAVPSA